MTRVIIHAGFHKTGTSSLQDYFGKHRKTLKPFVDFYRKSDFLAAGKLSNRYGLMPYIRRRLQFRFALRRFLNTIPEAENIVLSCEGFSGLMPGHRRFGARTIQNYTRSAIPLAKEIIREVQRRFGPDVQVEFLYTTRATEPWIKSVYGHLSRSIRIREDHAEFCGLFDTVPNLDHEAGKIAEAIAPVPVHTAALEHFGPKRLGMAQAIFELLDIPDEALAKLPKAKRTNVGQSEEITAKFCGLNNEIKNARALKQKKADILAGL